MLKATDRTRGTPILATPDAEAECPLCHESVRPKCGQIVSWHFAHRSRADCDPWSENEGEWHRDWKRRFPLDWCEVVIGPHRADVRGCNGWVLELQHSALAPAEIREREDFYLRHARGMAWVFDAQDAFANDRLRIRQPDSPMRVDDTSAYRVLRWIRPRTSVRFARARVLLDLGNERLFDLGRLYENGRGYGWIRSRDEILHWLWETTQLSLL
jgi:hypothetical protein